MTTEQSWSTILEFFLKDPKAGQTTIWKCTKFPQEAGREAKGTNFSPATDNSSCQCGLGGSLVFIGLGLITIMTQV